MTFNLINQKQFYYIFSTAKTLENSLKAAKNAVFQNRECPDAKSGRSKRESGAA